MVNDMIKCPYCGYGGFRVLELKGSGSMRSRDFYVQNVVAGLIITVVLALEQVEHLSLLLG
jgi:hypothetical protein